MKVKGYKPTKKCIKYIRKMISQGTWPINERIPTIGKISETLSISPTTVRNSIKFFERQGIIENYGSLGFFLKSKESITAPKSKLLLKHLKLNLEAANLLRDGATQIRNWIIKYDSDSKKIIALDTISGSKISCLYV